MPLITVTPGHTANAAKYMEVNGADVQTPFAAGWSAADLAAALTAAGHASTAAGNVVTVPASLTTLDLVRHEQEYLEDFEDPNAVGRMPDVRVGAAYSFAPGSGGFYSGEYAVGSAHWDGGNPITAANPASGGLHSRFWFQSLPGMGGVGGGVDGSGNPLGRYICFDADADAGTFYSDTLSVPEGVYIFEIDLCGSCLKPSIPGDDSSPRTIPCTTVPNVKLELTQAGVQKFSGASLTVPNDAVWKHITRGPFLLNSGAVEFALKNNVSGQSVVGNDVLMDNIRLTRVIHTYLAIDPDPVVVVDDAVRADVWLENAAGEEVAGTRRHVQRRNGVEEAPFLFSAAVPAGDTYTVRTANTTGAGNGGDTAASNVVTEWRCAPGDPADASATGPVATIVPDFGATGPVTPTPTPTPTTFQIGAWAKLSPAQRKQHIIDKEGVADIATRPYTAVANASTANAALAASAPGLRLHNSGAANTVQVSSGTAPATIHMTGVCGTISIQRDNITLVIDTTNCPTVRVHGSNTTVVFLGEWENPHYVLGIINRPGMVVTGTRVVGGVFIGTHGVGVEAVCMGFPCYPGDFLPYEPNARPVETADTEFYGVTFVRQGDAIQSVVVPEDQTPPWTYIKHTNVKLKLLIALDGPNSNNWTENGFDFKADMPGLVVEDVLIGGMTANFMGSQSDHGTGVVSHIQHKGGTYTRMILANQRNVELAGTNTITDSLFLGVRGGVVLGVSGKWDVVTEAYPQYGGPTNGVTTLNGCASRAALENAALSGTSIAVNGHVVSAAVESYPVKPAATLAWTVNTTVRIGTVDLT